MWPNETRCWTAAAIPYCAKVRAITGATCPSERYTIAISSAGVPCSISAITSDPTSSASARVPAASSSPTDGPGSIRASPAGSNSERSM